MQIWRTNPHLQTAARLLESTDAVAQAFAMSLPPQALVIDLRHPQFGRGFSWGRFGPKTRIRRAGEDRIWAIIPPERKPGFLTRIIGCCCGGCLTNAYRRATREGGGIFATEARG